MGTGPISKVSSTFKTRKEKEDGHDEQQIWEDCFVDWRFVLT